MEDVLKESARQVPAMVILLILCITFAKSGAAIIKAFLSQITETRQEFLTRSSESRTEFLKTLERFHVDDAQERSRIRETIQENSRQTANQSRAMENLTAEVHELRSTLSQAAEKFMK